MVRLNENSLEKFIRSNRDEFNASDPADNHMDKFFFRLRYGISHFVSIVPHLVRVAVMTMIVFTASVVVWNTFIRKDRHEITLGEKITLVITKIKNAGKH